VTQRVWTLVQVANELGIDRNTVRDRLNTYRLRYIQSPGR
jgi:DNA-binding protein Fis